MSHDQFTITPIGEPVTITLPCGDVASLRDNFAMAAMQGMLSIDIVWEDIPHNAYAMADAMLAEREKEQGK